MTLATIDLIRQAPLLAPLPPDLLKALADSAALVSRRKGARIFEEGSPADCCFLLTSGRAKIVLAAADGTEITIGVVQPFALVGEIALIDALPRSAGFVAIDDCRLLRIPRGAFLALRRQREFEERLMIHVAATLRRATEQLRAIYTYDAPERVAWCLSQIARQRALPTGHELALTPKPSHRELAEMTGTSRETVSRSLKQLQRKRWIRWDRTTIFLEPRPFSRYLGAGDDRPPAAPLDSLGAV